MAPVSAAVAYPCSSSSLEAVVRAGEMGVLRPVLIGPAEEIIEIAADGGLDLAGCEMIDTGCDPIGAANQAAEICCSGDAQMMVKGSLQTDDLLGCAVRKEAGLRTSRQMSHCFVFDVPAYAKPLLMADCVLNIEPDLEQKRDIVQNAIDLALRLEIAEPFAAILSAIETVNPAIPGTIDAAALSKMADDGQISGGIVKGPMALDVAISSEAAATKKIPRPARDPDILIAPNLEAGNMLYKQLVYLAGAECAGIIVGATVPIVLTSRADSIASRIASCALARLAIAD